MVEVFSGIYFKGEKKVYEEGSHPNVHVGNGQSFRVYDGYEVRFSAWADGGGQKSRVFYAGEYLDTGFYAGVGGSWRFDVVKNGISAEELVTGVNYVDAGTGEKNWFPTIFNVPPGRWAANAQDWADNKFPNDVLDEVRVPKNVTVRLRDVIGSENKLEFTGPINVNLKHYGYVDKVSEIEVLQEGWVVIEDVVDWDNAKEISRQRITGASVRVRNPSGAEITDNYSLKYTQENMYSRTWEVGGSITAGVSVEAEGGVPLVGKVKATVSVEATVSASGGGTDQTTTTEEKEHSLEVKAAPYSSFDLLAVYDKIKSEIPTYRVLRNKRTGAEVRQETTLIAFEGEEATIKSQDVAA